MIRKKFPTKKQILKKLGIKPEICYIDSPEANEECISACKKIIEENPTSCACALYETAIILHKQKHHKEATEYYGKALQILPEFFLLHLLKAFSHFDADEYAAAKESFLNYLEHDKNHVQTWCVVAKLEAIIFNKRAEALKILDHCEENATKDKDLIYGARGLILSRINPNSALLSFMQAQAETTDNTLKEKYSKDIYNLILKNTDPLKRTGMK